MRLLAIGVLLLAACSSKSGDATDGSGGGRDLAATAQPPDLTTPGVDLAPPESVLDAGHPVAAACGGDAGMCLLPRSECADSHWLLYYSAGTCVGGACQWTKNFMLCPSGCVNGGCMAGFTQRDDDFTPPPA
jgi:hypothetical protein